MFEEIVTALGFTMVGLVFFNIGVYFGERKNLNVEPEGKYPPVLPWNSGLVARALYNYRLNDYVRWNNPIQTIHNNRIGYDNLKTENIKLKEENLALVLANKEQKIRVDEAESDSKRKREEERRRDEQDEDRT